MGLALLLMSLLAGLSDLSRVDRVGDDLAIIASAVATVLGVVVIRFGRD